MDFIQKLVKKAEGATQLAKAADIGKLTKTAGNVAKLAKTTDIGKLAKAAENVAKKVAPAAEHQESEENFHPEHKKYFSAPKI